MSLELVPKKAPRASLPALISGAGKRAAWRFVEFFTVNIRNPNTRAAGAFLRWCEGQGINQPWRSAAGARGGIYRAIAGQAGGSHGQATPGLHSDAL
jgi:hypothetical protein